MDARGKGERRADGSGKRVVVEVTRGRMKGREGGGREGEGELDERGRKGGSE